MRTCLVLLVALGVLGWEVDPVLASPPEWCADGRSPVLVPPLQPLVTMLGEAAGQALECVYVNPDNGDLLQRTSTGLLVYRIALGLPMFTDGYVHWLLGSEGLETWLGSGLEPPWVVIASAANAPPGGAASIVAQTSPGATCSVEVTLPSGSASHAAGLIPKRGDSSGVVSWSWQVGQSTRPGRGQVKVTCDGATSTAALLIQ